MISIQYTLGVEVQTAAVAIDDEGNVPFVSLGAFEFVRCVDGSVVAVSSIVRVFGLPGDDKSAEAQEIADWVAEG